MYKTKAIVISIFFVALTIVVYSLFDASEVSLKIMGVIGLAQLFFSIYSWSKLTEVSFSPYIVFLFAAYVFTFGQSILYIFDKVSPAEDLMEQFSCSRIYPAQNLTLIFLAFFHIGAILSLNSKQHQSLISDERSDAYYINNQVKGVKTIGKIFIAISIVPFIIETYKTFTIASVFGYGGLYEQEARIGVSNIVSILSQYFLPGILCLLLVENKKTARLFYVSIIVLDIIFWMYVGGRTTGVILCAMLILYYHLCVKRIKLKQALVLGIAAYLFVSLLSVIGDNRSTSNRTLTQTFSSEVWEGEAFFGAISEMGGSMFPMITTMEIVPDSQKYKMGTSYLASLTSVIPNLGFWDLHPAMKYGNMNGWLQDSLDIQYGPGFSMVAEAYVNFGAFGFIIMMILGFVFARIMNIDARGLKNPLILVLSFVFCFLIIKTVRNSFLTTVRSVFYYILPIYLVVIYGYNGKLIDGHE